MPSVKKEPEHRIITGLTGIIHGQQYRQMNQNQKESYVTGVIDGLMFAFSVTKQTDSQQWLEECIKGMRVDELTAIVTKYAANNPEFSQATANRLVYHALVSLCKE
jgi:Rap1a immunity proteins